MTNKNLEVFDLSTSIFDKIKSNLIFDLFERPLGKADMEYGFVKNKNLIDIENVKLDLEDYFQSEFGTFKNENRNIISDLKLNEESDSDIEIRSFKNINNNDKNKDKHGDKFKNKNTKIDRKNLVVNSINRKNISKELLSLYELPSKRNVKAMISSKNMKIKGGEELEQSNSSEDYNNKEDESNNSQNENNNNNSKKNIISKQTSSNPKEKNNVVKNYQNIINNMKRIPTSLISLLSIKDLKSKVHLSNEIVKNFDIKSKNNPSFEDKSNYLSINNKIIKGLDLDSKLLNYKDKNKSIFIPVIRLNTDDFISFYSSIVSFINNIKISSLEANLSDICLSNNNENKNSNNNDNKNAQENENICQIKNKNQNSSSNLLNELHFSNFIKKNYDLFSKLENSKFLAHFNNNKIKFEESIKEFDNINNIDLVNFWNNIIEINLDCTNKRKKICRNIYYLLKTIKTDDIRNEELKMLTLMIDYEINQKLQYLLKEKSDITNLNVNKNDFHLHKLMIKTIYEFINNTLNKIKTS